MGSAALGGELPSWDAITGNTSAPEPQAAPAAVDAGSGPLPAPIPPAHQGRNPARGEVIDLDQQPKRRGNTWLNYLVLFIVAAVLGLLLWQLVSAGTPTTVDQGPGPSPAALSTILTTPAILGAFA
jgi:hypothetical protein